jgi:hypothetical protein
LKAPYRLHLPIIRVVEIRLRGFDIRMAHQRLNRFEVIPLIQQRTGKGLPDHMGMGGDGVQQTCLDRYWRTAFGSY